MIQADNHQENLVIADAKKLEADGLVNFITINEVRYITEYNQVVGPTHVSLPTVCQTVIYLFTIYSFPTKVYYLHLSKYIFIEEEEEEEKQNRKCVKARNKSVKIHLLYSNITHSPITP